jgi:starvation-inducible DNA-binding protein
MTKDFYRQMRDPDFHDYHLLLDDQAEQIFAIANDVAARAQHCATRKNNN